MGRQKSANGNLFRPIRDLIGLCTKPMVAPWATYLSPLRGWICVLEISRYTATLFTNFFGTTIIFMIVFLA